MNQFCGIEINDFAVSVAKTALWIAEEQMLEATQAILLTPLSFLPLRSNDGVIQANALRYDWNDLLPAGECDYIIGNPPFYGARMQSKEQKAEIQDVFHGAKNCGNVDYVAGWYMKAAEYMEDYPIRAAFVSTNSICQGEQVANIWEPIFKLGLHINFAYDTFRWKNEANDQAHVFVVIVGFSKQPSIKRLFHHDKPDAKTELFIPNNINAYLIDAPDVFIWNRAKPVCSVPSIRFGSMPNDGGNLLLAEDDLKAMIREDPASEQFIKPFMGASEFINNKKRWCIWLQNVPEEKYIDINCIAERVAATKQFRERSSRLATNKLANTPQLFGEIRQPGRSYVFIPRHSSERRRYIPLGYMSESVICGDSASLLPDASLYHFGVMMSQFHNAWMRIVAGRIKSDYRYSNGIVYNNFIWPDLLPEQRQTIEQAAKAVLDARAAHPGKSLAELYDPDKMPSDLLAAHEALDKAVEDAYGVDFDGGEEKIVAHLFKLYAQRAK